MSKLYNIGEIKLNGKSIKNVNTTELTKEQWETNTGRDTWNENTLVTMKTIKNLVTTAGGGRSVDVYFNDMIQDGTFYYDGGLSIDSDMYYDYYNEVFYGLKVGIPKAASGRTKAIIKNDTATEARQNIFIGSKITGLQNGIDYEIDFTLTTEIRFNQGYAISTFVVSDSHDNVSGSSDVDVNIYGNYSRPTMIITNYVDEDILELDDSQKSLGVIKLTFKHL